MKTSALLLSLIWILGSISISVSDQRCSRIVSLAPSITETLFELDLGSSIVGRTRYCLYPPLARKIPEIGGFLDTNLESIAATRPSIAILLKEQGELAVKLEALHIPTVIVDQRSVKGILDSISTIGRECHQEARATALRRKLEGSITTIQNQVAGITPKRAFVSVGRVAENGKLTSIFVAGSDGFYSDILKLAGGENANKGTTVTLPTVSPEGIIALNPDVIFEIVTEPGAESLSDSYLEALWHAIPGISNVPVFILRADYVGIPGPRFPLLLADIAARLHPEVKKIS